MHADDSDKGAGSATRGRARASESAAELRGALFSTAAFVYAFVAPKLYSQHQVAIDAYAKSLPKLF